MKNFLFFIFRLGNKKRVSAVTESGGHICVFNYRLQEGPFSVNMYQKYEAESFIKALGYPDFTFEMANVLSANGGLNVPVDAYKREGKPGGVPAPAAIIYSRPACCT
jgi:hypothetical protein